MRGEPPPQGSSLGRGVREPRIFDERAGSEPPGEFGRVRPERARPVSRDVDVRNRAAALRVGLREPLPADGVEGEAAAGEVRELRLGPQAVAERDRVAGDAPLAAARVPDHDGLDALRSFDAHRRHAIGGRHAARRQRRGVEEALGKGRGAGCEARGGAEPKAERGRVQDGGGRDADRGVLVGRHR